MDEAGPSLTGRRHGAEREVADLLIKRELHEVELAGGGQQLAQAGVNPAVVPHGGKVALEDTGRVGDAEGTRRGDTEKHRLGNRIQVLVRFSFMPSTTDSLAPPMVERGTTRDCQS